MKRTITRLDPGPLLGCFFAVALALLASACGANQDILRSGRESPTPSAPGSATGSKSSFDRDLEEFRTAEFNYIYVLRRKDGGVIDAADKAVIRQQTAGANRRVSADDDKALIIGSNPQPTPETVAPINA